MSSLNVDRMGRPRPGIPMRPLLRLPGKIPRTPGRTTGSSPAAAADLACGAMLPPTVGRDETWGAAVSPVKVTRPCYLRLPRQGARTLRRTTRQFTSRMSHFPETLEQGDGTTGHGRVENDQHSASLLPGRAHFHRTTILIRS